MDINEEEEQSPAKAREGIPQDMSTVYGIEPTRPLINPTFLFPTT